jgi:hypothetical protein
VRSGRGPVRHTLLLLAPAGDGHPGVRNRSGCICGCIRPRSARPGSGHTRAYDLPILLGWSSLIAGSTTLKASVPRGTGGSNPSASASLSSENVHFVLLATSRELRRGLSLGLSLLRGDGGGRRQGGGSCRVLGGCSLGPLCLAVYVTRRRV